MSHADKDTSMDAIHSEPSGRRWLQDSNRAPTTLHAESRASRHAHLIKRPRAWQYSNPDAGVLALHESLEKRTSHDTEGDREERSTENIPKQLSRLELFVDLIWVGIIANISTTYGETAFSESGVGIGVAVLEFLLLFVPIWRVWDQLRAYNSNFYIDDLIQRNFTIWILILAVLYGINAPFAFALEGPMSYTLVISVYLLIRASFLVANGIQSFFQPWLRRQWVFVLCTTILTSGLWIAAIFVNRPIRIALLIVANALEHPLAIIMASPIGDRLLAGGWKKSTNVEHYVERHEEFYIIVLGEGVFRLINGSPSGIGIHSATGTVISTLLIYYILHWLYFNGDQSKEFVHAVRRTWWKPMVWRLAHLTLFASLLALDASTLFLVENSDVNVSNSGAKVRRQESESSSESPNEDAHLILQALWSASISLSVALFCMTVVAFLNRPLDKPKTLVVNSRYIRLCIRPIAIVVILCLPLFKHLTGASWCGGAVLTLYFCFLWEWFTGLERNWTVIEPKEDGGSVMSRSPTGTAD